MREEPLSLNRGLSYCQAFCSEASGNEKITALRKACKRHVDLTKECAKGLGQDRHLYALYCLLLRERGGNLEPSSDDPAPPHPSSGSLPSIFTDHGWHVLNTSILSTSNCGNPALHLFGFGPVAADGYGIGYIIKEDGISMQVGSVFTLRLLANSFYSQLRFFETPADAKVLRYHPWLLARYPEDANPTPP